MRDPYDHFYRKANSRHAIPSSWKRWLPREEKEMASRVVRTSKEGTATACCKTLDDAMRRAVMTHEDGKGCETVVYENGSEVARLSSNGDPQSLDDRYVFVPVDTGDWKKRPTRYHVYKKLA